MKVMIFDRYTWPSGRWEEATYVMGVKQGRGVEVRSYFVTEWKIGNIVTPGE